MENDSTIDFYNHNANLYYQCTAIVDMSEIANRFLTHVKDAGCIIDIGAGSGRDLKFFSDKGYMAEGIDASEKLCVLAREHSKCQVYCVKIQDWVPEKKYDGIWANASLVHLTCSEIEDFFGKLDDVLNDNGVAYLSFKQGVKTGFDEKGRFFSDFSEEKVQQLIGKSTAIELIDFWKSEDKMKREDFFWINFIVQKAGK